MKIRKKRPPAAAPADVVLEFAAALGLPFPGIELFDRIGDIVFFIKDEEARYVAVNETLVLRCKVGGKSALIGRKASEVFAPPLGDRFEAQDLRVLAEGLSIHGRLELHLYPDGSEGWCLTWKEPLVGSDGSIRGLAGISRDAPAPSRPGRASEALSVRSPISTSILMRRCAFRISLSAPACPPSSSIRGSEPSSASPQGSISPG